MKKLLTVSLLFALLFVAGCQSNANSPVSNPDNSVSSDESVPKDPPATEPVPPVSPEPIAADPSPVSESTTEKTPQPSEPAPVSTAQPTQPEPQSQQAAQPSQTTKVIKIELSPQINADELNAAYKKAQAEKAIDEEMKAKAGRVEVVGDGTNGTNNGDEIIIKKNGPTE